MNATRQGNRSDEELREQIIEEAGRLFSKFGPAKTTMQDIASRLSMSQGNLYNYFTSKSAIIEAVGDRIYGDFSARIDAALAGTSEGWAKVEVIFISIYHFVRDDSGDEQDIIRQRLIEGRGQWGYAMKFEAYLLDSLTRILSAAASPGQPQTADGRSHARVIADCMAFGLAPSRVLHDIDPAEHEARVRAQLAFVHAGLQALGYRL